MDLDGREIGILHNIVVDGATGLLSELVVKPAAELDTTGFKADTRTGTGGISSKISGFLSNC